MTWIGQLFALGGLFVAAALFWREDLGAIVHLLALAGAGLVVASAVHIVPMMINTTAWRQLFAPPLRAPWRPLLWATWARESVNALLPVARIGGEIVAYRIVRRTDIGNAAVAASIVVDMALAILTQAAFTLFGLALLMLHGVGRTVVLQVGVAGAVLIALGVAFVVVQRAGVAGAGTRLLNRLAAGRFEAAIPGSQRLDAAIAQIYRRRGDLARCAAWQCLGWIAGTAEIWLALHFLGHHRGIFDAIMIDALIQAISSVVFVIPGALGVQEGGFLLLGAAIGLDGTSALALAAARRFRDLVVYFPGLVVWHWAEVRIRDHDAKRASSRSS